MEKERRKLFPVAIALVSLVLMGNLGVFFYKYANINTGGFTGFSIRTVREITFDAGAISFSTKIYLIIQWALILSFLIYTFYRDNSIVSKKNELANVKQFKNSTKNNTDLDILYDILKKNKTVRISVVSKTFKIDKDLAIEWAKILESGDLAKIEYPGFSEPRVVFKEKKDINEVDDKTGKLGKLDSKVKRGDKKNWNKEESDKTESVEEGDGKIKDNKESNDKIEDNKESNDKNENINEKRENQGIVNTNVKSKEKSIEKKSMKSNFFKKIFNRDKKKNVVKIGKKGMMDKNNNKNNHKNNKVKFTKNSKLKKDKKDKK